MFQTAGHRSVVHVRQRIKHRYVKTWYELDRYLKFFERTLLFKEMVRLISASQGSFLYDHVAALYAQLHVASYVDSFCWSNTLARLVGSAPSNGERCRTGVR